MLCPRPVADATVAEFDTDLQEFSNGFLVLSAVGGGIALLGDNQLPGDGFSPPARVPPAAMPQGHEQAGGGPQLADREVGIFFPRDSGGTRPGTED